MSADHEEWLGRLAEEHGRMVFATACRILGHADDAEDALQDVFLKVLRTGRSRNGQAAVRDWGAYLHVMATRAAIEILRRRKRYRRDGGELTDDVVAVATVAGEDARGAAIRRERAALLRQALRRLSERDARVFALHYFDDWPYESIAAEMRLTVSLVGVILHRARRRLREILEPILEPAFSGPARGGGGCGSSSSSSRSSESKPCAAAEKGE